MFWLLSTALAAPLPPLQTLATERVAEADLLGAGLTVHVFLQLHAANKGRQGMVETETSRACASRIGETAEQLVSLGVTHAIVEGLQLGGDYLQPKPSRYKSKGSGAAATLSRVPGLTLWGMENGTAQPRQGETWQTIRDSAQALKELRTDKQTWSTPEDRLARLYEIQGELYPANTEMVIATLPLRSFQALQGAFSVAEEADVDSLMIVIGAKHWPDFAYAISQADRVGNDRHVALRLIQYSCEAPAN